MNLYEVVLSVEESRGDILEFKVVAEGPELALQKAVLRFKTLYSGRSAHVRKIEYKGNVVI